MQKIIGVITRDGKQPKSSTSIFSGLIARVITIARSLMCTDPKAEKDPVKKPKTKTKLNQLCHNQQNHFN